MAIRTRIDPIERDVQVIIAEDLSPEAQSRALASFARGELQDAQTINRSALGRLPPHRTWVDGAETTAIEAVRPTGRIVFEFDLLQELFQWIEAQIVEHAPRKTGRFQASFIFLADGVEVPVAAPPEAAEFVFVNTQPYARKIERGLSAQAPDGVMEAVAVLASKRFGNVARVRFGYRSLLGDHRVASRSRAEAKARRDQRQPAIVITV